METIFKYIVIIASVYLFSACSGYRLDTQELGEDKCVEFVMRPTSFMSCDVGSVATKATLTDEELTEIEKAVNSLYFLVFGADGHLIEELSDLSGSPVIQSKTIYHNAKNGPLTVCYLANVPSSYVELLNHIDRLSDTPLALTYADYAETGYVGIPNVEGSLCFPMFGKVTYPGTEINGNQVQVPLKRLMAKLVVNIKTDFEADFWDSIFNAPKLELYSATINNLPSNVILSEAELEDSEWVKYENEEDGIKYFEESISVDLDITINNEQDIETYTEVLSIYVPEYYLKEIDNNTDQKLKPQMYAPDKRPVYMTIDGLASQTNFVDVPLKYNIFFGGDATSNFDLLRNVKYNNNMTIIGTTEAILGEDDRVEATYHNLANPDNIGEEVPANCYIISKPGRYLIPMCKGNQPTNLLPGTSAEIVHINHLNSAQNSIPNNKISIQKINGKKYIQFDVNMYDASGNLSLTDVVPSNELLCLKDDNGNIVWSWHLWMCDDNNRPEKHLNVYPVTEKIVLNRALGSIHDAGEQILGFPYWDDGLYYQWGRKDPMLPSGNPTASSSTYAKSVQNPRTFYTDWNASGAGWASTTNSKTVDDPCPPGYKVPTLDIWRSGENSSTELEDLLARGLTAYPYNLNSSLDVSHNVVYPFSSFITNGALEPFTSTPYSNAKIEDKVIINNALYTTIYFSGDLTQHQGEIWASDGSIYFDRFKRTLAEGSRVYVRVKFSVNLIFTTINYDEWIPSDPNPDGPGGFTLGSIKTQILNTVGDEWGSTARRVVDRLIGNIDIDGMVSGFLEAMMTVNQNYKPKPKTDSDALPVSRGAHVRCVREDSPVQ